MRRLQSGLSAFGALLLLAVAGIAGYYVYKGVTEEASTCAGAQSACVKSCRRSASEAAVAQACQEACQREADSCSSLRR